VFLRFRTFILLILTFLLGASLVVRAQQQQDSQDKKPKADEKPKALDATGKNLTAEQVADSVVLVYSAFGGRNSLKQIRKTTHERGRLTLINAEGKSEQANYARWIMRADSLDKEKIRYDQEFPGTRFALVYSGDKIFGLFNDAVFTPREDASKAFENQIWRGLEALLRYKENGSTVSLAGKEKMLGVEFHLLDVTDKQNRKTRFYVSTKFFKVMMLEYTDGGVKYRRKFYDYNYAQGTLVPYRTVLWANDKQIEETQIGTISFGLKLEESMFQGS
jgi:phage protein U